MPEAFNSHDILRGLLLFLDGTEFRYVHRTEHWGSCDIKNPHENARLGNESYHQDVRGNDDTIVYWCSAKPTKIRTDDNGMPGKRIGGDIRPFDVTLIQDGRCWHARPDNLTVQDNRWFAALLVNCNG